MSTRETRIQQAFDVRMEMFDWIGLLTNVVKTVSMACQPCCAIEGHSAEAYVFSTTGEGITYQERLRQQVRYPECNVDLLVGSLATHW